MTKNEFKSLIEKNVAAYPAFSRLYGEALLARCETSPKQSFLLDALVSKIRVVDHWEETCQKFLQLVTNPDTAVLKIVKEINGAWKNNFFDSRLKDSILELHVVCDLSTRGVTHITALEANDIKQPDFSCRVLVEEKDLEACLEVKNLRAPIGITEAFQIAFEDASRSNPLLRQYRLSIQHHWDNTASDEQRDAVAGFVGTLRAEDAGIYKDLTLHDQMDGDIYIRAALLQGCNGLVLSRPEGGSFPVGPHVREDALLGQISQKIERAIGQLASCSDRVKLIALNIDSPTMTIDSAIAASAQQIAREKSHDSAKCLIFLNHCYLEC